VSSNGLVHPQLGVPVHVYEYPRASGEVAFVNARFEPKDFRVAHPTSNGRWAWTIGEQTPQLLYALPDVELALANGDTIWITDGEKDADALSDRGICATCCARAQGWSAELAEQLIGVRSVTIVADWDGGPGLRQALEVRELLLAVTGIGSHEIEIVRAVEGKDAYDHLHAGHGLDEFVPVDEDEITPEGDAPPVIVVERLRDFRERELPPFESLVGVGRDGTNLLPRFGWVMPWGQAGSGKTSLLVDLLFHACSGIDWLGWHVERPLRIVVIVNEGIPGALQDKLKQKLERWSHDDALVLDNLSVWVSPWGEFTFRDERHVEYVRSFALDVDADYVALDPLHTVATTNTGAPDETEAFKRTLQSFGVWRDLGVITTHHANKTKLISGDWDRHPDTVLRLEKEPKQPATKLTLEKARPADPSELGVPMLLKWDVETLGYERVEITATPASLDEQAVLDVVLDVMRAQPHEWALDPLLDEADFSDVDQSGNAKGRRAVVKRAIEQGQIVNLAPSAAPGGRQQHRLVLPNVPEAQTVQDALPLDEPQSGTVEPDQNVQTLPDGEGSTQKREVRNVQRPNPRRGLDVDGDVRAGSDADVDDDLPDFGGRLT
jgi:hypothetical protein